MYESEEDLRNLQALLDESHAAARPHLRSIFTAERRLSAAALADALRGAFLLDVATVTAAGTPLVAPVDGLFYRGRVWIGFPPGSVRGAHLRARPQVSATHTREGVVCLIVHGTAREVDASSAECAGYVAYCREVYGPVYELSRARYRERRGEGFDAWIEPRRLFAVA